MSHSCYFLKVPACLPAFHQASRHYGQKLWSSETISPNKPFLVQVALVIVSYNDSRKVAKIAILLETFVINLLSVMSKSYLAFSFLNSRNLSLLICSFLNSSCNGSINSFISEILYFYDILVFKHVFDIRVCVFNP